MTPQEIQDVYNDLAQVPQNTATQATTELGQNQAARGTSLAQMGSSGGNGIGNYTYNRLIDPTVQQLATQLVTTGRSQALNRAITLAQQQASENYQKAYNNYVNRQRARARASSGSGTGTASNKNGGASIGGIEEKATNGSGTKINDYQQYKAMQQWKNAGNDTFYQKMREAYGYDAKQADAAWNYVDRGFKGVVGGIGFVDPGTAKDKSWIGVNSELNPKGATITINPKYIQF